MTASRLRLRPVLALLGKIAVSAALLALLVHEIDLADAIDRFSRVSAVVLAAVLALLLAHTVLSASRWQGVIRAIGAAMTFRDVFGLTFIGAFFSQVLPSTIGGDVVRVYLAHRRGMPASAAIIGVVLERVLTLLGLVVVVVAALPWFLAVVEPAVGRPILIVAVLLALGAVVGLGLLTNLHRVPAALSHLRAVRGLEAIAAGARSLFLSRTRLAGPLAWTLLAHLNLVLCVYLLAKGLGLPLRPIDGLTLVPLALLATSLPISIAGWGVREAVMVSALALVGVPGEGAFALSVIFGLLSTVAALPGGLIWLASGARRDDIAWPEPPAAR